MPGQRQGSCAASVMSRGIRRAGSNRMPDRCSSAGQGHPRCVISLTQLHSPCNFADILIDAVSCNAILTQAPASMNTR